MFEVPLDFENNPGFEVQNLAEDSVAINADSQTRLLLLKNKKTDVIESYLVHFISKNKNNASSSNLTKSKIVSIDKDFNGMLLLTNMDGEFIRGSYIKKGKHFGRLNKTKVDSKSIEGRPDPIEDPGVPGDGGGGSGCTLWKTVWMTQICTTWSDGIVTCGSWEVTSIEYYNVCEDIPPGGGSGTGNNPTPGEVIIRERIDILNEITTPCLKKTLDGVLVSKLENSIAKSMKTLYGKNTDANLFFRDGFNLETKTDGICTAEYRSTYGDKIFIDCVINLNNNTLENSSKEYVVATILHEGIHAVMRYNGLTDKMDHFDMALSYVETLASGIQEIYPNVSKNDAIDLAWGGLQESASWNYLKNTNPGLASRIIATNDYYKRNVVGTSNCQ
ncbi:hypothetical protein [Solitalea canadensis]|nr:hypothetical protein [Solitalea canadensis]